jgi:hypothetical protein
LKLPEGVQFQVSEDDPTLADARVGTSTRA